MLVMRTIKDPPDTDSGFNMGTYDELCKITYGHGFCVSEDYNVRITSQVERTEPDGMAVEEADEAYTKHDSDTIEEAISTGYDEGEHTSMEGEDTGSLESDMGCADGSTDGDTDTVVGTTGHNDQEDTNKNVDADRRLPDTEMEGLDIQFVKVITT